MKKKWLLILLGIVVIILVAAVSYIAGSNGKNNASVSSNKTSSAQKVSHKQKKPSSSVSSESHMQDSSTSSQVDSNLLQDSDLEGSILSNQYLMKSVIYYSIMTGSDNNDKMWNNFKSIMLDPTQYPAMQVNIKSMGTGMYLTSSLMGGVDVAWPTIMWDWGEKAQNPTGQPDFTAKAQDDGFEFSKQDVLNYINQNGGKSILNTVNINVANENSENEYDNN